MAFVAEQLLNALALAALLFLVSAGLSLVFGILRVVNFAHGVFYMLGAYLAFTAVTVSGQFWLSLLLVPPVVGIVGALLEASTLRFIYRRPPIYQLLLTFGLALILEESVHVLYGPTAKSVDPPALLQGSVQVLGAAYPRYRLFLVVLGVAVGVAVWLFLTRTRAGLVVRAVAQNSEMADCLGADVPRVRTLVFGAQVDNSDHNLVDLGIYTMSEGGQPVTVSSATGGEQYVGFGAYPFINASGAVA